MREREGERERKPARVREGETEKVDRGRERKGLSKLREVEQYGNISLRPKNIKQLSHSDVQRVRDYGKYLTQRNKEVAENDEDHS